MKYPNWNLTTSQRRYRAADALILSVGKSGRTWLRVMLGKYLALRAGEEFDLDRLPADAPRLVYEHELWSWRQLPFRLRLTGKHLCPDPLLRQKKVVLLYRDPRDVVVSMYFQRSKRSRNASQVPLKALIRPPHDELGAIVEVMNTWYRRLADHPDVLWLNYETMRRDPGGELARLVTHLGLVPAPDLIQAAVDYAAFENMKKMEASGQFASAKLRPGDPNDPQSFKVRAGKVAGYLKHFDAEDLIQVDRVLGGLACFYGYFPGQHAGLADERPA
ncbi:MAG: sulfotransferase domain-containing protein [Pseudomonadota bacterium]